MKSTPDTNEIAPFRIFTGQGVPHEGISALPHPPPWRAPRKITKLVQRKRLKASVPRKFEFDESDLDHVNAALYLRRPLLVTGKPGTGKSSLAHAIAHELRLGQVLEWPITTRSTLQDGLYRYDAIARVQDNKPLAAIGDYIKLGPLGTALLPTKKPRVLLIDEIDKSDIDLPNDLLHVFEKGWYEIPELVRLPESQAVVKVRPHDSIGKDDVVDIERGRVYCQAFPVVILTSNAEREFPPAFLRRCIRLDIKEPNDEKLARIIEAQLPEATKAASSPLIKKFLEQRSKGELATDQLLNAVYLAMHRDVSSETLVDVVLRALNT
jgi:MoxR-like ATPase